MTGWSRADAEQLIAGADAVLSQGGGFAMEHYGPWPRLRSWTLVVERGLPMAFCAQSIGPWRDPANRAMLERVYAAAVVVGLRESDSVANVLDLGVPRDRVVVTADEVFSLFAPLGDAYPDGRGIACVLSGDPWPRRDGAIVARDDPVAALAELVGHLVRLADGERVTLLSTQQGLSGLGRGLEDDARLAARVIDSLPADAAPAVETVPGYIAPLRCADLIASHRGLVSMRMHPAIFGICRGVPTALLTDAFKATAMFEMLGLQDVLVRSGDGPGVIDAKLRRGGAENARGLENARARAAANDDVVRRLVAAVGPERSTLRRVTRRAVRIFSRRSARTWRSRRDRMRGAPPARGSAGDANDGKDRAVG
jgi:colanic acid/amylovoran biosynthesis protein